MKDHKQECERLARYLSDDIPIYYDDRERAAQYLRAFPLLVALMERLNSVHIASCPACSKHEPDDNHDAWCKYAAAQQALEKIK